MKGLFHVLLLATLLSVAILTCGCTSPEPGKNPQVTNSVQAPGSNASSVDLGINDTIPDAYHYRTSAKLYQYETDLQKMPEIVSGYMKQNEISRYQSLLDKLNSKDPDAARWVVRMGLFAEDRKISDDELAFADAVAMNDDPLRVLVSGWARSGISPQSSGYAANVSFQDGEYGYLADDLQKIESLKGPVDPATKDKLKHIVRASLNDYELRKGLYLIDEYGVPAPDRGFYQYPVPAYNTQLSVLLDLLKNKDIPPEYYRFALAACLDYGAVETVGDEEVKKNLPKYVSDTVDFTIETDRLIKEQGYNWQAKDYPLEADMTLAWGAAATMRPYAYSRNDEEFPPDYHPWNHPSWESDFRVKPMNMVDFRWSFVDLQTLREMRQDMMGKNLPRTLAEYIRSGYKGRYNEYQDLKIFNRRFVNYTAGYPVYVRDKTNVDLDWENYRNTGILDSACYSEFYLHGIDKNACYDKTFDEKTLSRSMNVASFLGAAVKNREDGITIFFFTHLPVLLTFDQNDSSLQPFSEDISSMKIYNQEMYHHTHRESDRSKLVFENMYYAILPVPWDNYSNRNLFSKFYMDGMDPLEFQPASKGTTKVSIPITEMISFPSGYIFRSPYASVTDYEKT
jgi:hypothetical protein